jgi:hypothetical protein
MNLPLVNWLFDLHCPLCRNSTLLPRQSPLGKYDDRAYRTKGEWPIAFLCRSYEQVCECNAAMIRPRLPVQKVGQRQGQILWETEVRCAHGSCELTTPIYATYHLGDTSSLVIDLLLSVDPILDCRDYAHGLKLRRERIKANPLVF